jgi:hypothetical protein
MLDGNVGLVVRDIFGTVLTAFKDLQAPDITSRDSGIVQSSCLGCSTTSQSLEGFVTSPKQSLVWRNEQLRQRFHTLFTCIIPV